MMNSSFDLLSLPRRNQLNYGSMEKKLGSGLPINSLPGWELIPLNSKLPMLKCPGNQVIFSKDKIGQSLLKALKHDFDTSAQEKIPEYNPLHDLNLRNFYANENNLKRLRVNGEITENNDVICTLKDFNEYRQQIHKSFIYYLLKEMRRLNNEQNDRKLINYASNVTGNDYANINLRTQSYHQILARREQVHEERMRRYQVSLQRTEEKFQRIAERQQMNENLLKHKKYLHDLKMRQHTEARDELQRKKLIYVKKLFQFKKQRFQRAIRNLVEQKNKTDLDKQTELWEKRLNGRIAYQEHINKLMEMKKNDRDLFIQNHIEHYRTLWSKIQMDIKQRTRLSKVSGKKKKKKLNRRGSVEYITSRKQAILIQLSPSASDERIRPPAQDNMFQFELYDQNLAAKDQPNMQETSDGLSSVNSQNDLQERNEMREKFNNMVEEELVHVLNKAIDIQGNAHLPFDKNDPTYKVASFIVNFIIKTMQTDLSTNRRAMKDLTQRVLKYFNDVKTFILYRSSQIIAEKRDNVFRMRESITSKRARPSHVSFSRFSSTIGISSYAINPHVNLRRVQTRKPTPVGSLASILAAENKTTPSYEMTRIEIVFMEYYHVKFKRELSVSIGKRVFAAIEGHFRGERTLVRKELLELDKTYLAQTAAQAILGHAVNELNFLSALKLCSSALTADIIWALQRQLLRPERDVKGSKVQKPKSKDWLCLFYDYDYQEHFEGEPIPPSEGLINRTD